jgi:hypothetical protein
MTREEILKRFPHAAESFIALNSSRVSPADPERPARVPLDRPAPRKASGRPVSARRYRITYRAFSLRPLDWDNWDYKRLTDMLVTSGILAGDSWRELEGCVISCKAGQKSEERTEITIEEITCHRG